MKAGEGAKAMRLATESVTAPNDVLGYVTFDDVGVDFGVREQVETVTCYMISDKDPPRGIYVQIGDRDNGDVSFVGRILDGPFYTQKPGAYFLIELTTMLVGDHRTVVQTRPKPASPVKLLEPKDVQSYVGATGDFTIGRLLGQSNVEIAIDSAGLNRHIGIFGTTGGGKSNSLQVITEEASEARRAVLIFDIEGEYVAMNEPTDALIPLLSRFGKKPKGMKNFQVYVPAPNSSKNIDAKKFGIPFSEIDLEIFSEVMGLTPFERVYLYDIARKTKEISQAFRSYSIGSVVDVLKKRIDAQIDRASLPEAVAEAHMGLYTKLSLVSRSGILDAHQAGEVFDRIPPEDFCVPGRISVIDVSESSDIVRNICIAHLLKQIFDYKTRVVDAPPILIFVEEIHTFLSRAKRRTMTATLTMLTEMARKGRKRGIGLGFVSQQPSLVPSELIELCNTRFMHRTSSEPNLAVLRKSTGNVPDSLWSLLPSLGNGEVLIASPKFYHAVVAQIRPNMSRRLRVEYT
jgi:DNA helicase HerA-like ATPase